MSFIKGQSDPLFRAIMEELLSRFRGSNPSGTAVGHKWRIIEGSYPTKDAPSCIMLQHLNGTQWITHFAIRTDSKDALRCTAIYETSSGQSIADTTATTVDFASKKIDTDNAVTTGANWKFTVPPFKGGLYHIDTVITYVVPGATTIETWSSLRVNTVSVHRGQRIRHRDGGATALGASAAFLVSLNPGDAVDFQVIQTSGGARTLETLALANWIAIQRIPIS